MQLIAEDSRGTGLRGHLRDEVQQLDGLLEGVLAVVGDKIQEVLQVVGEAEDLGGQVLLPV